MICISVGDPRRPYPLDIEMRSGLLGKMQDRHVTGRLLLEQDNVANAAFSEHERTSPSLTQNGHHTQAVPGKSIGQRIFFLSAPESQTVVRIPAACKFFCFTSTVYLPSAWLWCTCIRAKFAYMNWIFVQCCLDSGAPTWRSALNSAQNEVRITRSWLWYHLQFVFFAYSYPLRVNSIRIYRITRQLISSRTL